MKLTPRALRLISEAVRGLPDPKVRDQWLAWIDTGSSGELPANTVDIAIRALIGVARRIEERLDSGQLDEDQEADAVNDLGLIHAIENDLKRELSLKQHA